ncbi:MAG: hypothetical protein ACYC23_21875 [Limisphaerales bacterium]
MKLALLGQALAKEIAKTAKTGVVWVSNHDVVENFDFEKLARSNEVTGDFNVGLGWSRLAAYAECGISGVMPHPVLCRIVRDLHWFSRRNHWLDAA